MTVCNDPLGTGNRAYSGHHIMIHNQSVITDVITKIADREGIDAAQLDTPIFEVIDPEALSRLFRDGTGQVSFRYRGYSVTVDHTGHVELGPQMVP